MDGARRQLLRQLLRERVLVLDGAMGTAIQALGLGPDDFGGEALDGCNEVLVQTRPDAIRGIHAAYLEAGADIVETDTFGGTPLVLGEYGLAERARELNRLAARLAREVAADFDRPGRPRLVAGSMGPTTRALSVTGGIGFDELRDHYREQALGLIEGGADYLLVETIQDTLNAKAALLGIDEARRALGLDVPVALSATIETTGTMLAGQTVEAFVAAVLHADPIYLGLNCATGPEAMADHVRALAGRSPVPVAVVPNAGLPDEDGRYRETPEAMAAVLERFLAEGWADLLGGCCGTTPDHVRAFARLAAGRRPRRPPLLHGRTFLSGLESLELTEDNRPVLVGERTNLIGSRRFKRLIREGDFEAASEIGRRQVRGGAQVIDVCLADPDGDEAGDLERFLERVVRKVKVPLMLDSTDAEVFARGLRWCQGKSILNSVNLEDGEERVERVVGLARRFGAAVVFGCIDEDPVQGMALTRQRKLAIAERAHDLLVQRLGLPPEDIVFDPLVFPCATGDRAYLGSALETVEGVRLIGKALPQCRTILGISNVSFGLPPAAREVVNAVFLYHATLAGLDLAIVNPERLERYPSIPAADRRLAERVLFETDQEAVAEITARFRGERPSARRPEERLGLDERLARCIVEGSREGLKRDLDAKLREAPALAIINGPLMAGMEEVGRLFNANQLIVAEVLQSAEVMKAAIDHLEPHLEHADVPRRGTVLLATVKGDVHDIGKNLVDIILSNNGYRVVNLGIKVPPQRLIEAVREHRPDLIGLSGLLVKSTAQMVVTAEELTNAGLTPPLLVGGAALTRNFTARRIAAAYGGLAIYAQDAMEGLSLADRLLDPERRPDLEAEWERTRRELDRPDAGRPAAPAPAAGPERAAVTVLDEVPEPPTWERRVLDLDLDTVWAYVNPAMLYNRHLGLKGKFDRLVAREDPRALKLRDLVADLQRECRAGGMRARAVWQAFAAESDGETIRLRRAGEEAPAAAFTFPRQRGGERLCLADYVRPAGRPGAGTDNVVLFVVTAGGGVRERAAELKERGEFLRSHALQALALETAEASAEWLHAELRRGWGFPDPPGTTMLDLFRANYRGRRYSFGYPACPDLEDQRLLFDLLRPEQIGVRLTEGLMMDPEASVSALVLHHPEAVYFSVGLRGDAGD